MNLFRFAHPVMIYLYILIPVFVILYIIMKRWKKKALNRFGDASVIHRLFPDVSVSRPGIKFILLMMALFLFIAALCGPLIGSKLEEVKRKGVDIIIALDVSNSMKAEDIRPSRLERSKQAISRLIDKLQGDRVGLVVFAGDAYMQLPLTTDYGAAKLFLSTVEPDIVPRQGTAIGAAIEMAATSFTDSSRKHSAIIVITDGENHEDNAVEAAKDAWDQGVRTYTIGMGSPEGAPIPMFNNGMRIGFRQDNDGKTVITKLDPVALQEIAEAGHGRFVRASNSDDGLQVVLRDLDTLEKKEFQSKMFTDYENQYQYFAAAALLLLLIEYLLGERKSKWYQKMNLFGVHKNTN
ncbi:MAG: VWA domain-containing protein [Bacteroidota bacterium]